MDRSIPPVVSLSPRTGGVRLRTLIYLRWLAVLGQTLAVLVATQYLGVDLRLDVCVMLIGLSALFNLAATLVHPEAKRLTPRDATLTLLYDLGQLVVLLYFTGGVTNPFVTLLLAQTVIAATVLTLRATMFLGALSLAAVALLSVLYVPLTLADGSQLTIPPPLVLGVWASISLSIVFIGTYARLVSTETGNMAEALAATQLALEREQTLTAMGGVVAAAAHELGTPLATIMLTSGEMADDLADRPELAEDIALIHAQARRCRAILAEMGRSGKEDPHVRQAPFSAVVEEAANPHLDRGKAVVLRVRGRVPGDPTTAPQPVVQRRPEVIHGVRNLVQNAVDFAAKRVWIDLDWTDEHLLLKVGDDGPGYPSELLGRIGEPYLRGRSTRARREGVRPGYSGMGLGLFIAKTLLERTGGRLTFANGARPPEGAGDTAAAPTGAIVEVVWNRGDIESEPFESTYGGKDATRTADTATLAVSS